MANLDANECRRFENIKRTADEGMEFWYAQDLGANLFRITQTEAKMRRAAPQGLDEASGIHCVVGKSVRETIEKIGGTMPGGLPTPEKSISQAEREQLKRLKKDRKKLMLDE